MSFYPVIKIPVPLERAYRSEPVLAPFDTASKTTIISAPPQRYSFLALALESGLTTLTSGICWSIYGGFAASGLILAGGTILVAAHILLMHLTYPERWYLYHEQVDRYRKQQWAEEFNQARAARLQTQDGITRYRQQKVLSVLAQTATPQSGTVMLSAAATQFAQVIIDWLPMQIRTDSGLVLVDLESNLHIQVEIDEPYQNINGEVQVTHYAGSAADHKYDKLCLDRGWVVVRFSAVQAKEHATSCYKVIAEAIAELLQDESWLIPFTDVENLAAVPQWTEFEAHRLAKLAQREYA